MRFNNSERFLEKQQRRPKQFDDKSIQIIELKHHTQHNTNDYKNYNPTINYSCYTNEKYDVDHNLIIKEYKRNRELQRQNCIRKQFLYNDYIYCWRTRYRNTKLQFQHSLKAIYGIICIIFWAYYINNVYGLQFIPNTNNKVTNLTGSAATNHHQQQQQQPYDSYSGGSAGLHYNGDIVAQFSLIPDHGNGNLNWSPTTTIAATPSAGGQQLYPQKSKNIPATATTTPIQGATGGSLSKTYFTHLAYDSKHNKFYAGATNKILQFNANLRVLSQATTGPKHDSPQCHASGCSDDVETSLVNNYNKILIVSHVEDHGILIACGSIRQGACDIYNLSLFPNNSHFIDIPLAANDELATTYAFVGPAEYSWKREDILYVGTTFTNVGDYRHDVPAISSRRLDNLNYAEFEIKQSIINIDVKYRDHFLVDYVYGFNSSEYAYFALVQKKSHLADEAGYITRLARICITDSNYDSYTEITIQCLVNDHQHIDYNIMRDAKITGAGQKLAQQLGIKRDDQILVAIFSPSLEISNEPINKSAMCIYSLKEIEEIFNENIHLCFNGTIKDRNLGYISGTIDDGRCPGVG